MCGVTLTQNRYTSVRLSDVFLQGVKAIITIEKFECENQTMYKLGQCISVTYLCFLNATVWH